MTFISDSTEIEFCGKDMGEAYQMGRADAIDEFVNEIIYLIKCKWILNELKIKKISEQLKEQAND